MIGNELDKNFVDTLQEIGNNHNLHVDQIGVLVEATKAVVSGTLRPDDFVGRLIDELQIDPADIIDIATEINLKIFSELRKGFTGNNVPQRNPALSASDSRDSILSAIENPTPVVHPISIAQPKPSEKMRPSSGDGVAREFIGEKLVAPVSLPSQKIVVPPTPPQPVTTVVKPKPALDPYREPIE